VRTLIAREFEEAFSRVDLIIGPTSPTPAFRIGEKEDPISMYLSDVFTLPSALAGLPAVSILTGLPAVSIPGGKVDGLPFGLQLIGPRLSEVKLLRTAHAFTKSPPKMGRMRISPPAKVSPKTIPPNPMDPTSPRNAPAG